MKIITWNINGYRSADKLGRVNELISRNKPDIICLQEIKMNNEIINNYNNNMFIFEEKAMIDKLLSKGLLDSFRVKVKEGNVYSWWPNRFNARERNLGWRIDYIFISEILGKNIKNAKYLKEQYGSDHCPYILELDI
ncbi:MAG: endonuclease/exonuclease/phosphatase family protein [Bacilli bacterium]|nr:endonuclease/exonuclease/phosphatase family protein [Bacilli bacterium]